MKLKCLWIDYHQYCSFCLFLVFSVQNLKETIERLHGIPVEKQVLLISGGEVLQPGTRVCSYSSGTDENPIYMFSTIFNKEKNLLPWPSIESRKCYMFPQHHRKCFSSASFLIILHRISFSIIIFCFLVCGRFNCCDRCIQQISAFDWYVYQLTHLN